MTFRLFYILWILSTLGACSKKEEVSTASLSSINSVSPNTFPTGTKVQTSEDPTAEVKTDLANFRTFEKTLHFEAIVQSDQDIVLRSITSGYVEKVAKKLGDWVSKGAVLAHIQTSTNEARMNEAKANFSFLSKEFDRMFKLFQDNTITKSQFDEIQNRKSVSESQFQMAHRNYEQSILKSPIDGSIEKWDLDLGEVVNPQQELIRIVNTKDLKLLIGVSSQDIFKLNKQQEVKISFTQLPEKSYTGRIRFVSSVADPISKNFPIEISIVNNDNKIKVGLIANIMIELEAHKEKLSVPKTAVLRDENKNAYVYKVEKNHLFKQKVTTGSENAQFVEILEGLNKQDSVVTEGQNKLKEGNKVRISQN